MTPYDPRVATRVARCILKWIATLPPSLQRNNDSMGTFAERLLTWHEAMDLSGRHATSGHRQLARIVAWELELDLPDEATLHAASMLSCAMARFRASFGPAARLALPHLVSMWTDRLDSMGMQTELAAVLRFMTGKEASSWYERDIYRQIELSSCHFSQGLFENFNRYVQDLCQSPNGGVLKTRAICTYWRTGPATS